MLAKFRFVKLVPPALSSFDHQEVVEKLFMKYQKSKPNKLCAMQGISVFSNSTTFLLQKSCAYPLISPVICE